jgi:hypothetical protein
VQRAIARRDIGNSNRAHDRGESSGTIRTFVIETSARANFVRPALVVAVWIVIGNATII